MSSTPYPFQSEDAKTVRQRFQGRALISWEMGLGKTFAALLIAQDLDAWPIVVVCPASLKWQWRNECRKHFGLRAEVLSSMRARKHGWERPPPVTIINFDVLRPWIKFL